MCKGQNCPNIRKNETAMAHIPSAAANTYEARYDVSAIPSIPFCISGGGMNRKMIKERCANYQLTISSIAMGSS
jgi:hypothetical protein